MWWTQPQTPLYGLAHSAFQPSHCFQLNPLPCKHMGNQWVFLFSCRSRVLNNIQKDSATYHPSVAKIWSPDFFLFFPTFSPLDFGERECRWKGTDTQWCNLEKHWLTVIKVIEQTERRSSTERGRQRLEEETWNTMACNAAQSTKSDVAYDLLRLMCPCWPKCSHPCLSFLKLNKQHVTRFSTYHPSVTLCVRFSVSRLQRLCLQFDLCLCMRA